MFCEKPSERTIFSTYCSPLDYLLFQHQRLHPVIKFVLYHFINFVACLISINSNSCIRFNIRINFIRFKYHLSNLYDKFPNKLSYHI